MAEEKMMRISKVAKELNVGVNTIVDFLASKGHVIENNPNAKISQEQHSLLLKDKAFASSAAEKQEASSLNIGKTRADSFVIDSGSQKEKKQKEEDDLFTKGFESKTVQQTPEPKKEAPAKPVEDEMEKTKLQGLKVLGKIDLNAPKKPAVAETPAEPKTQAVNTVVAPIEQPTTPSVAAPAPELVEQPKPSPEPVEPSKPVVIEQPKAEEAKAPIKEAAEPAKEEKEAVGSTQKTKKQADTTEQKDEPAQVETQQPSAVTQTQSETTDSDEFDVDVDAEHELIEAKAEQLKGLTVLGKIELPNERSKKPYTKPGATPATPLSEEDKKKKAKRKRKRVKVGAVPVGGSSATTVAGGALSAQAKKEAADKAAKEGPNRPKVAAEHPTRNKDKFATNKKGGNQQRPAEKAEVTDKEIQEQIKQTLAKLSGGKGTTQVSRARYRRDKRSAMADAMEEKLLQEQQESKVLRVTEFVSANDLAAMMDVSINQIISTCLSLGMFVSINQRLDAEAITVIADEFGYEVDFSASEEDIIAPEEEEDNPEDLSERAPIVTIMGHVDHGKTSLLDYIRKSKVTTQEAGGITQHIGAYDVTTSTGKKITFLDTPGHEAFTAMRARGAKVTDVVIIVVAADDNVMPQTKEAINHAQVAGVPIVIAINKVDKPTANPDKIREELAQLNILVEDWGGKYQCEEISAKTGHGINELLEKVLLEAELLELKANPNKNAQGTVIEAMLDKGRGYVATVLVQSGTLKVGDTMLAGSHFGRVKAMFDHRGKKMKEAGPSIPVQVLGLGGAPQAGDRFNVMDSEREAREIANKREQLQREQNLRTKKHITLDEIGRRLAIGTFKELNVIVKGDVDGSVEALSDSLLKLSTNEVQVNIIHKAVGQISESDVLLASASDAIIIGFQVRPSPSARKLAEQEQIEIRLYSIIYDAINELKDAMEGMLAPKVEEIMVGAAEIREVFKISKVGNIAGCYVTEGFIKRNNSIKVVRDGIVVHSGEIDALKRFKDDTNEVKYGYEFGMSIKNFNDFRVGDTIESFEQKETKRTL